MNTSSLVILVIAAVLIASGVFLVLERTLSRIFIGLGLITHGLNVLLLSSGGAAGRPPLLSSENASAMADPLPQAMILTSIVLSLGTTAFGLALSYRSWRLSGHDEVVDDVEDRLIARRSDSVAVTVAEDDIATGNEDSNINYDEHGYGDTGGGSAGAAGGVDISSDNRSDRTNTVGEGTS